MRSMEDLDHGREKFCLLTKVARLFLLPDLAHMAEVALGRRLEYTSTAEDMSQKGDEVEIFKAIQRRLNWKTFTLLY